HVPRLPEVGPEDPGPFSFAAERRVRGILERAGFRAIELEPINLSLDLANGRGLDAAVDAALGIGPPSRPLDGPPVALRAGAGVGQCLTSAAVRMLASRYQAISAQPKCGGVEMGLTFATALKIHC